MRYELKNLNGQLKPKAALVLENIEGVNLYHALHGLRHPLGIFNFTFGEVVDKATVLLDRLESARDGMARLDPKFRNWDRELLDATDHFLDAVMQHLDSFKSVICCFYEDGSSKAAQKSLRSLGQDIRGYRDHVAKIVNAIKHKQRCLRFICFHDVGIFVPGYFVEGVLRDGVIGPDPDIHAGANVAISYNRDLPFHFCSIFYAGAVLAQHIYSITGVVPKKESKQNDALLRVLRRVAVLPMTFFPDELKKTVPMIRGIGAKNESPDAILLEMPASRFKPKTVTGCRISVYWKGDGASLNYKVPYMGKDAK